MMMSSESENSIQQLNKDSLYSNFNTSLTIYIVLDFVNTMQFKLNIRTTSKSKFASRIPY